MSGGFPGYGNDTPLNQLEEKDLDPGVEVLYQYKQLRYQK